MDTYEAILDFFAKAEQAVRTGDIVKATGIDKKEVEKVMNRLKKEGKIVSPKRCYWEIKKD
ncbi:MAG: FaeA/PapI family transcriptional regulator [Thermacetogeniaceae bacterium]|jgi:DNA-binding IclR family transcriptional regulator|nr:MarR family transcriptional regulator [Syntrophomonadaceae bacterium]